MSKTNAVDLRSEKGAPATATVQTIPPDELMIYKLYRERVSQEDELINHRMMWMILSQAFMLALWVALFGLFKNDTSAAHDILYAVDTVGLLFSVGSKLSISAAQGQIEELKGKYRLLFDASASNEPSPGAGLLPSLAGTRTFHWLGHVMPSYMPVVLSVLWTTLAAITWLRLVPHGQGG